MYHGGFQTHLGLALLSTVWEARKVSRASRGWISGLPTLIVLRVRWRVVVFGPKEHDEWPKLFKQVHVDP